MNKLTNSIEKIFQKIPPLRFLYVSLAKRVSLLMLFAGLHKGENILDEEFDYLIILDSCRYDIFKEVNFLKGNLSKKITLGTQTYEWLGKTFTKKYDYLINDLVYVSSIPMTSITFGENSMKIDKMRISERVYKLESMWKHHWDEKHKVVLPQAVRKEALRSIKKNPLKRFIIHFSQPHQPFIRSDYSIGESCLDVSKKPKTAFSLARRGKMKREEILNLYKDNLVLVLKEVEKLIENLEGKIVITSDHGEAFGEKFIWEHMSEVYIKELTEVPWLVINKPKRNKEKKIIAATINQLNL